MRYQYYNREALRPIALVRRAVKQAGSYAILATQEPRGERREVLLMIGREGRERIPIVLENDKSVANVVGSCLARVQGEQLAGVLGFASDTAAQHARQRYTAGELTLNLITNPIAGVELTAYECFHGVDGPALVLTAWSPIQVVLSSS